MNTKNMNYYNENNVIGIDIGTTETKCTLVKLDAGTVTIRRKTPSVQQIDAEKIIFKPYEIWKVVYSLLTEVKEKYALDTFLLSVVSQAPSICMWSKNNKELAIGVSYLSYYGDSKKNSYYDRLNKMKRRLELAETLYNGDEPAIITGINGYIVFMLTNAVTVDSITAWEMGIETEQSVELLNQFVSPHRFGLVVAPLEQYRNNFSGFSKNSIVIAGTTDSGVLPLSTGGFFSDYYVYLGTWGSLLRSEIKKEDDYNKRYFEGDLHTWIISVPNFIENVENNSAFLDEFFYNVSLYVKPEEKISICGGLCFKYAGLISNLCNKL